MRLRRFLPLALLGAAACSSDSQPRATAAATATQRREAIAQLRIPIAEPVLLDSTADVLYPLPLHELVTEETSSYGSSSYGRTDTYWNILFYNTHSGASHLLDASRRMNIQSYRVPHGYGSTVNSVEEARYAQKTAGSQTAQLIFYDVLTADTNRDGELTSDDPTYIFTSDKTGKDFRQISPDSLHVSGWDIQHSTGRVLLQTVRDANHDHRFGDGDETIPYVYDPATGQPARRVFAPAVVQQLRAAFQSKWEKTPVR